MPATRAAAVDQTVVALASGRSVVLVGERGAGRTTSARQVATALGQELLRGTGLRLLHQPHVTAAIAVRHEGGLQEVPPGALLLVEDVQWADPETVDVLEGLERPVLVTATPGADCLARLPFEVIELLPLEDEEARDLLLGGHADETTGHRLRRTGGNVRLLRTLQPGVAPRGPALRTLTSLSADLDHAQRELVLLLGAAGGSLPVDEADPAAGALLAAGHLQRVDGLRLRIGALGELALAQAAPEARASAHRRVAVLLAEDAAAAPHLLAAGDHEAARRAALTAVRAGGLPPAATADLLLLADGVAPEGGTAGLPDDLADLLAQSLWQTWRLDELLARDAATGPQRRVALLARTARGEAPDGSGPAGALLRERFAGGVLSGAGPDEDLDARLARAASALAAGKAPSIPDPVTHDLEQRWQAGALGVLAAWLDGADTRSSLDRLDAAVVSSDTTRWSALAQLLRAVVDTQVVGASAAAAEALASLLDAVPAPAPAWGTAALALVHADLGSATDAERVLAAAVPTSAFDRQVLALVAAECELATGRPRRAVKVLDGVELWPALDLQGALLRAWALSTVAEPVLDRVDAAPPTTGVALAAAAELAAVRGQDAHGFVAAAELWQGICARRALHCRWAAAETRRRDGSPDVEALRELEGLALDGGLLPLLARVREALRRTGVKLQRSASGATGASGLSPREVEVLGLVREGLTSAQAATRLGVAQSTVETQVASAMRKLGARTRRQAVALLDRASA